MDLHVAVCNFLFSLNFVQFTHFLNVLRNDLLPGSIPIAVSMIASLLV